jgi:hypothetical protein
MITHEPLSATERVEWKERIDALDSATRPRTWPEILDRALLDLDDKDAEIENLSIIIKAAVITLRIEGKTLMAAMMSKESGLNI